MRLNKLDEFLSREVDITWVMYLVRIWCWIIGHDTVCVKRHTTMWDEIPRTTASVHICLRCKARFEEQWDD